MDPSLCRVGIIGYLYLVKLRARPLIVFLLFCGCGTSSAQVEVFVRSDFELRGPVRTSTVLTDYGEERFEFDREGKLLKTLTRYSDTDYDITYYRYGAGQLNERRDEVYRDGSFDKSTSFARFYERDSLTGEVTENITSYDRQFREQLTYHYDSIGRLERIVRIGQEGNDNTLVSYSENGGEVTAEYQKNGQLVKAVRTSEKEGKEGPIENTLVREYFQGTPQKAVEQEVDTRGRLLKETRFEYDSTTASFRKVQLRSLTYNEDGFEAREHITWFRGNGSVYREEESTYLYQMDGASPGNWIRKIKTPENSFISRKITYFESLPEMAADSTDGN